MNSGSRISSLWEQRSDAGPPQPTSRRSQDTSRTDAPANGDDSRMSKEDARGAVHAHRALEGPRGLRAQNVKSEADAHVSSIPRDDLQHTSAVGRNFTVTGWRFHTIMAALCITTFLSTIESTIVSPSLINITNALGGLQSSSWIVNAYLITYTSVLIIAAKLSDIFGRKPVFLLANITFIVFSVACGVAQTFVQLTVFRALQGVGAGGMYGIVWVVLVELTPPETYAKYSAVMASVFALSALLGPLLGGLINDHTTWRWIFLLNGPGGAIILMLVLIALPWNFPRPASEPYRFAASFNWNNVRKVDATGGLLLLAANILLIAALEEGGTTYSWESATVLSLLFVSIFVWSLFAFWSKWLSRHLSHKESIFPWRIATDRFAMGTIVLAFFNGGAFVTAIIILPQRFQIVNGLSPLEAAYRLLALTVSVPISAGLAGSLMHRFRVPPFFLFLGGALVIMLGMGLAQHVSSVVGKVPGEMYGYQVIMGLGLGMGFSVVLMAVPIMFEIRDTAVGMGAINQSRMFGGSVCLSIAANVLNSSLKRQLSSVLSSGDLNSLLKSASVIERLPADTQLRVREAYGSGFKVQLWVLFAFGAGALLSVLTLWERPLRKAKTSQDQDMEEKTSNSSDSSDFTA